MREGLQLTLEALSFLGRAPILMSAMNIYTLIAVVGRAIWWNEKKKAEKRAQVLPAPSGEHEGHPSFAIILIAALAFLTLLLFLLAPGH